MATEADNSPKRRRRRGIYLLPNLFTTAALFAGFFSVVSAINHRFEEAAIAIFIAMVLDGLDGRIARLTGTQSDFGAEYDSLADMVSFGIAPAMVVYVWSLSSFGKFGWPPAFLYTACAALRLARFNTQLGVADKRYFQGLASPAAAATVAGLIWFATEYELAPLDMRWVAMVVTVIAALLMVSRLRYRSFKDFDFRDRVPFVFAVVVALAFFAVAFKPAAMLFLVAVAYAASGPIGTAIQLRRRRRERQQPGVG